LEIRHKRLESDDLIAKTMTITMRLLRVVIRLPITAYYHQRSGQMATTIHFDPAKVAYYEATGWKENYDHRWVRVFTLMIRMNHEEFGMSWPTAALAAIDIVRAAVAWSPMDNDIPTATHHLEKYFAKARRAAGLSASAKELADLEIDYWIVHRQLAIRRLKDHSDEDIEPMIESLARLHAALFESTPEAMRPSAEYRALAAMTVDRITGHYTDDVPGDWQRIEQYLRQAYQAVLDARSPMAKAADLQAA
jgi:hypothetical protein